jgi:Leucine-rich repeat (LRR) protein
MTAGVLVTRVIQQLLSGTVEERNKIVGDLTSSASNLTFQYPLGSLRESCVFEIDSELLYVWQANASAKTAEVERGFGGTTAATHAVSSTVTVNPRFPRHQILSAMNTELADLSSPVNGLFQMKTVDISYNGSDRMVNLTGVTDIQDIYDVRYRYQNDDYPIVRNVRLLTNMPTADFPSGNALAFDASVRSGTVRVLYKAPFGLFTSESSTITSVGIASNLEDLVVLGTQIRMMAGREIKRNFIESQGDTRRSDEVPAGAITNSMLGLQRLRAQRIVAESARLARQYPLRIRK